MQHLFIAGPGEREREGGEAVASPLSVSLCRPSSIPAASSFAGGSIYSVGVPVTDTPTAPAAAAQLVGGEGGGGVKEGLAWNYGASPACEVVSNEE